MSFPNQYRPFQINHGLLYRQLPPSEHLQEVVAFFWELRNPAPGWVPYNIIADGCVDFIAGLYGDHRLKISVSQWAPTTLPLPPGASLWGVRLYPATFSLVFGVPMSALTTHYWFDFAEISDLPDLPFLSEALAEQDSLLRKQAVFEQFLTRYMLQHAPLEEHRLFNVMHDIYQTLYHRPRHAAARARTPEHRRPDR